MVEAKQPSREIFTFPFNNARQIISIGVALPTVCILVVVLRFLTRLLQKVRLGLDDWLSLGGLVSALYGSVYLRKTNLIPVDRWL